MDPKVVVIVLGLAAFVSLGDQDAFYVMVPNQEVVAAMLGSQHPHHSRLTVYDEKAQTMVDHDFTKGFDLTLSGAHSFGSKEAFVISSGKTPMRAECMPDGDLSRCTYLDQKGQPYLDVEGRPILDKQGKPFPLVELVGRIRGGHATMSGFDAAEFDHDTWQRTSAGTLCGFVDYEDEARPFTELEGQAHATLGDVYVVESEGVPATGPRPVLKMGEASLKLGLLKDCEQWTNVAGTSCYPLIISSLPKDHPNININQHSPFIYHALDDGHVNVLHELVRNGRRPIPVQLVRGAGYSPYKCRTPGIVQE